MCGIVGYVGHRDAVSFILPGLRRLEYRGYDSAGIATVSRMALDVRKTAGKIADLETLLAADRPQGTLGVGHTRWATHGRPSDANAHPHLDCQSQVAIVHNGIIENYRELRKALVADGHRFRSQTDTEVIAHLIERYQTNGLAGAVLRAARDLQGPYAAACIASNAPAPLVASPSWGSRIESWPVSTGCALSRVAARGMPRWSESTWSKRLPGCPSRSILPRSSAIATRSSTAGCSRFRSPSRGRPPTPWPPCARPGTRVPEQSRSAMWSAARWREKPMAWSTPERASSSASPRRKPSRPSSPRLSSSRPSPA